MLDVKQIGRDEEYSISCVDCHAALFDSTKPGPVDSVGILVRTPCDCDPDDEKKGPPENKRLTTPVVVLLVFVMLFLSYLVYASHNRYYVVKSGQHTAYKVDRFTGEAWFLAPHPNKTRKIK
ncbi:MAG: hypothetical protein OXU79_19850 [Gemmatimonadota bacterium]|nr:hypothetical protein [Gemmatimonadota bacterium]